MRTTVSAMQISVDGFIEDPEGKQDWVDNWADEYGLVDQVDTCVLGSGPENRRSERTTLE